MGVQCFHPSKEPSDPLNKKKIQPNPNPNNPPGGDDVKSQSKLSDTKKGNEKKKKTPVVNAKDFIQFENSLVRTYTKENKKTQRFNLFKKQTKPEKTKYNNYFNIKKALSKHETNIERNKYKENDEDNNNIINIENENFEL